MSKSSGRQSQVVGKLKDAEEREFELIVAREQRLELGFRVVLLHAVHQRLREGVGADVAQHVDRHALGSRRADRLGGPLGEVADEFNRYGIVQFVIQDAGLRALRDDLVVDTASQNAYNAIAAPNYAMDVIGGVRASRLFIAPMNHSPVPFARRATTTASPIRPCSTRVVSQSTATSRMNWKAGCPS